MTPHTPITPYECANIERTIDKTRYPCPEKASNICKGCFLVQYCSKDCQQAHWNTHKKDCKSPLSKSNWQPGWVSENREPAFVDVDGTEPFSDFNAFGNQKYLWGNIPALDILNLPKNEGTSYTKDFRLLFAASGDIRNVVKSLEGLPRAYPGHCEVIINDRDPDIVFRNAILLLTAFHISPEIATPIMVHIWYSALLPKHELCTLQNEILPLIQEVCQKTQGKAAHSLLSKTWIFGTRSLRLILTKKQWDRFPEYFKVPDGLTVNQARDIRASTTLAPVRRDYVERSFLNLPSAQRVCTMRFRQDGILVPFGSSRKDFDTPNPTFYQTAHSWPMLDSANPLEGWPIDEVMQKAPLAKHDIYGSLYFYLQDILMKFCRKIYMLKLSVQLYQVDALELPSILQRHQAVGAEQCSFDRIELSNITDRGYLGPDRALATFSPLLAPLSSSPHATILGLFLNATHEMDDMFSTAKSLHANARLIHSYIPITRDMRLRHESTDRSSSNPDLIKFMSANLLFRDWDALFRQFQHECRLDAIVDANGLRTKNKHSIVDPWPFRIRKNATQSEFDTLLASGQNGSERYVEWGRRN